MSSQPVPTWNPTWVRTAEAFPWRKGCIFGYGAHLAEATDGPPMNLVYWDAEYHLDPDTGVPMNAAPTYWADLPPVFHEAWIPYSSAPHECPPGEYVLVQGPNVSSYINAPPIAIMKYDDGTWWTVDAELYCYDDIRLWMPLPKGPQDV